jgi:hypothetical protein
MICGKTMKKIQLTKKDSCKKGRICTKCGIWKPWLGFPIRNSKLHTYRAVCKICHYQQKRDYYLKNHEKIRAYYKQYRKRFTPQDYRKQYLNTKYGLSWNDYRLLFKYQQGKCAICKRKLRYFVGSHKQRGATVDHDHNTGHVRGLLCRDCNLGLGYFKDNPQLLLKAIKYVK